MAIFRYLAIVAAFMLIAAACGSSVVENTEPTAPAVTTPSTSDEEASDHSGDDVEEHSDEFEFGSPVEPTATGRVVEIEARDDFTFSPANVVVDAGETVTFRVTNVGVIPHDFTLGDGHTQDEHEAEMAEMGPEMAMHDEPNAFFLGAGETREMTWHMTEAGEIFFGCHQPGHFAAGMVGTLTIDA